MNKYVELLQAMNNFGNVAVAFVGVMRDHDISELIKLKKVYQDLIEVVEKYYKPDNNIERRFDEYIKWLALFFNDINKVKQLVTVLEQTTVSNYTDSNDFFFKKLFGMKQNIHRLRSFPIIAFENHFDNMREWIDEMKRNPHKKILSFDPVKNNLLKQISNALDIAILNTSLPISKYRELDHYDYKYALLKKFEPSWLDAENGIKKRWLEQLVAF